MDSSFRSEWKGVHSAVPISQLWRVPLKWSRSTKHARDLALFVLWLGSMAYGQFLPIGMEGGAFRGPDLATLEDANEMESEHETRQRSGVVRIVFGLNGLWTIT